MGPSEDPDHRLSRIGYQREPLPYLPPRSNPHNPVGATISGVGIASCIVRKVSLMDDLGQTLKRNVSRVNGSRWLPLAMSL